VWGSGGIDPLFLTSAVGGEWSASRPGRFTPGTHWIGGFGYVCVLEEEEDRKERAKQNGLTTGTPG
jgi:hypothetical protein